MCLGNLAVCKPLPEEILRLVIAWQQQQSLCSRLNRTSVPTRTLEHGGAKHIVPIVAANDKLAIPNPSEEGLTQLDRGCDLSRR